MKQHSVSPVSRRREKKNWTTFPSFLSSYSHCFIIADLRKGSGRKQKSGKVPTPRVTTPHRRVLSDLLSSCGAKHCDNAACGKRRHTQRLLRSDRKYDCSTYCRVWMHVPIADPGGQQETQYAGCINIY